MNQHIDLQKTPILPFQIIYFYVKSVEKPENQMSFNKHIENQIIHLPFLEMARFDH